MCILDEKFKFVFNFEEKYGIGYVKLSQKKQNITNLKGNVKIQSVIERWSDYNKVEYSKLCKRIIANNKDPTPIPQNAYAQIKEREFQEIEELLAFQKKQLYYKKYEFMIRMKKVKIILYIIVIQSPIKSHSAKADLNLKKAYLVIGNYCLLVTILIIVIKSFVKLIE